MNTMSDEKKDRPHIPFTVPMASEESFYEEVKLLSNPLLTDEEIMDYYEVKRRKLHWCPACWTTDEGDTIEGLREDKWLVGPSRKLERTETGHLALCLGMQIPKSDYDEYAQRIAHLIKGKVEEGTAVEDQRWLVVDGERILLWGEGSWTWMEWGVGSAKLQSFSERGEEILRRLYAEIDWRKTATR